MKKSKSSTDKSQPIKPESTKSEILPVAKAETSQPKSLPWRMIAIVVGTIVFFSASMFGYAYTRHPRSILDNITIAGLPMAGLDTLTATRKLEKNWTELTRQGLVFTIQNEKITVPIAGAVSKENEVVFDLATFNIDQAVNSAYDHGRNGKWWENGWTRLTAWLGQKKNFGTININREELEVTLREKLVGYEKLAVNAGLQVAGENLAVTDSQAGQVINFSLAINQAEQQLKRLVLNPIALTTVTQQPEIVSTPTLQGLVDAQLDELKTQPKISLTAGERIWKISSQKFLELLGFDLIDGQPAIRFDPVKTDEYLSGLRNETDIEAKDARFRIAGSRVVEFQASRLGREMDAAATLKNLNDKVFLEKIQTVDIAFNEVKPLTDTVSTNQLGITELVAEGFTDFKGSPPNRIYNLTLGSDRLNGLLIKPGEVFSLVTALGEINAANGWKPELVIKGSKITPEYGGGLCQVATTLFRAALNTGLPIVERRNHSLRVSYYEPPIGLDATIYEPKPDLRFSNDYANALLLQTRVEGTKLIYSFYGTKDGRQVDIPTPKVFNQTGIPATQRYEVDDLPPGKEECQKGFPGASALATYTVTKAGQDPVVVEFSSLYRALPMICRVGKAAPAPEPQPKPDTKKPATNSE